MWTDSLRNDAAPVCGNPVARLLLRLLGWKLQGHLPDTRKFVVIGAPHTSLLDYPLTALLLKSFCLRLQWPARKVHFFWLWRPLMRAFGAIRPDSTGGFVGDMVSRFNAGEDMVLGLVPEGATSFVPRWKSGFYHIAHGAGVPVVPGFIDYKTRTIGFGPALSLSGDIDRDLSLLREFYTDKQGRHPERAGPVKI